MWTTYLAALLTPTVALLGLYIAHRQWRTAQNKLKLDLFERRLAVYESARGFISSVMTSGKTTPDKEFEYLTGIRGAKWLFGDDVVHYLDKFLWHKACDLWSLQEELDGLPPSEERTLKVHAKAEIRKWLIYQLEVLDSKFAPYIKLRH